MSPDHIQEEFCEIDITDVGYGGDAIGKLPDGMTIFIPFCALGDRVKVRVVSRLKRYARGEVVELLTPGPDRQEPACRHYGTCGGCVYQHISHESEVALKCKQLTDLLTRMGGFSELPALDPIVRSPSDLGYRNRITLQPIRIDEMRVHYGYTALDGRSRFTVRDCPISMPEVSNFITRLSKTKWGQNNSTRPSPKPATIRIDSRGERYAWFGHGPASIPWPHEVLDDDSVIRVPLDSFTQVNPAVGKELLAWLRRQVTDRPTDVFIDAYCGSGAFALVAAKHTAAVYGLEEDSAAIAAARTNGESLGFSNCVWIDGDVGSNIAGVLDASAARGTVRVLLDPPRNGCRPEVIAAILAAKPQEVIAVSCNPATLARDLAQLKESYKITSLGFFDMFPRTAHFESIAVLQLI